MMSIYDAVVETAANQLGIPEGKVTLETKIPDIHHLGLMVAVKTGKVIIINNLQKNIQLKKLLNCLKKNKYLRSD